MPGPMQHLIDKGFPRPGWAAEEEIHTRNGKPQWEYRAGFLSPRAVQDLAWLLVDGWDVFIHTNKSKVRIRITRKETE